MISQLSPIETIWHGYRFRSRLEARWATFFACLEIKFQYEPEGFILRNGERYLPDFFLPTVSHWAEIKPIPFTETERRKAELLVQDSGCPCLLLVGPPDFTVYEVIAWDSGNFTVYTATLDIDEHLRRYYNDEHRFFAFPAEPVTEQHCTDPYREAVYASRAARFERDDS